MITFKEYLVEEESRVKVGDNVEVHYRKLNGDAVSKGTHKVTKVGVHHFEIDKTDAEGKPLKFKHSGYGRDYGSMKSGRIKGVSRSSGHFIKNLTEEVINEQGQGFSGESRAKVKEMGLAHAKKVHGNDVTEYGEDRYGETHYRNKKKEKVATFKKDGMGGYHMHVYDKPIKDLKEESELDEAIKGWKNAHSDIMKHRSEQGKSVELVSLKKDGNESKMHDARKTFNSEEEARRHHERVKGLNPNRHIAHNLYIDGKHVEKLS